MRWLLPFIIVVVLAFGTIDHAAAVRRKRQRVGGAVGGAVDRPAWGYARGAPPGGAGSLDHAVTGPGDEQAALLQRARFDAATGILTWFDDENYN